MQDSGKGRRNRVPEQLVCRYRVTCCGCPYNGILRLRLYAYGNIVPIQIHDE